MKNALITLFLSLAVTPGAGASWLDSFANTKEFLSSRDETHKAVLALEADPLHKNAELVRSILAVHYHEDVDYFICGTVLGPLTEQKTLMPVMWQIIIASGDWVEAHPDRAKDIDAYTLAGLESGVRAYQRVLSSDPGSRYALMDELDAEYRNGTLDQWNIDHPCGAD